MVTRQVGRRQMFERSTGIRQIHLGLLVFAAWRTGRYRDVGIVLMSLSVIPLSDFLVWLVLLLPIGAYVAIADRSRPSVDGQPASASRS